MKASNALWQEKLAGKMPEALAREVDIFETEIKLRKQGKLDERLFAETRLRRGVYGQRYDNGQRHDGEKVQQIAYASGDLTKGPTTMWDAPGMQRIKIPAGGLNAAQLETLGELAEEYSDGIAHVTTRQDFQLHYIHIEDTPSVMRRLAAAGITTREACGNSVRNVTACPYAGVCQDETFDVTPYAHALARFLLGHPDCQNFGRKFKPAFSGCAQHPCGLVNLHDVGFIAKTRTVDGREQRGFDTYVGGGLGAVPYMAKPFDSFVPVEEILPLVQAIARVFARLGEKKNRARARIKFLVQDLGIVKFTELVREERKILPHDPRWVEYIREAEKQEETPLRRIGEWPPPSANAAFTRWFKTNLRPQKQAGYFVVTISLPLGDITANQLRALADIARKYTRETLRSTVEQNIVLRWVAQNDLLALYRELDAMRLADPGANSVSDIVTCPGTDTCKLGISSSRGLAGELRDRMIAKGESLDPSIQDLHIKISGCFNSCGQHHAADLGFYGVSRKMGGYAVPHFQVVLGGEWTHNVGSYGMPVMAIPSKHVPEVVERLTTRYAEGRKDGELFKDFIKRMGKAELKNLLDDLSHAPQDPEDRSIFTDWGDPREYSLGDMGMGECAGEVVSPVDFALAGAERGVFEAQIALEAGQFQKAGETAWQAMLRAAQGLVSLEVADVPSDPERIVAEFRSRFYDTQKFFDPFAARNFGQYFFSAHEKASEPYTEDSARFRIDEAHLFVEAAHNCSQRITAAAAERGKGIPGLMELQHVNVKLQLADEAARDLATLIPVFHSWIQDQIFGELLLDIADYRHVPAGPGIVIIGQDGDFSVDDTDGLLGVRYNRKKPLQGSNQDRLRQAARAALTACTRLETEARLGGKFKFGGRRVEVFINDRLLAPNTDATRQASASELAAFFKKLFGGGGFSLAYESDPRRRFSVAATMEQPLRLSQLISNLNAA